MSDRIKKYVLLIAIAAMVFVLYPCAAFASSTISSVTRIDVSEGQIKGENADYTFVLPKSWQNGSVTVNREKPTQNAQFLDKLIFLYIPLDKIAKPAVIATLYVCDNQSGEPPASARKLLETDQYVFAIESTATNNFIDAADKSAFERMLTGAANDSMMSGQIEVPRSQRRIPINTITVNGRLLGNKAVINATGTVYIPMREACMALGYSVNWSAVDSEITIYSRDRRHIISVNLSPFQQNYSTLVINDRAYVTSVFFMRALNAHIEVDGNNNVVINTPEY